MTVNRDHDADDFVTTVDVRERQVSDAQIRQFEGYVAGLHR